MAEWLLNLLRSLYGKASDLMDLVALFSHNQLSGHAPWYRNPVLQVRLRFPKSLVREIQRISTQPYWVVDHFPDLGMISVNVETYEKIRSLHQDSKRQNGVMKKIDCIHMIYLEVI